MLIFFAFLLNLLVLCIKNNLQNLFVFLFSNYLFVLIFKII